MADKTPSAVTFTGTRKFTRFSAGPDRRMQSARTPWLSRRHTPYVKTPKAGRTSRIQPQTEDVDIRKRVTRSSRIEQSKQTHEGLRVSNSKTKTREEHPKDPFQDLIGRTLRVYHASPLFNFDFNDSSLRSYENQLSAHLELDLEKGTLFASHSDNVNGKYKAEIAVIKGLSDDDSNSSAVRITVSLSSKNGRSKQTLTPVLTVMICSVGNVVMEDVRIRDHFTSLPVCLAKGHAVLVRSLLSWLEVRFDCRVTPMSFSSTELAWFFSLWAGLPSPGRKSVPIELCYDVPLAKGLSRILFSIDQNNARELWEEIHGTNSLIFTEEESITFIKALESHFYHHFKINLAALPLSRVRTSVAYIGSEGRLKIVHPQFIDHILEQLTQAVLTKELYGRL